MLELKAELEKKYSLVISGDFNKQDAEGYKARPDALAIPIKLPITWRQKERNTEFNLHAWRFLNPFWRALLDTGDIRYLTNALYFMEDWLKQLDSGGKSAFNWYDMATGIRAMHLAFAIEYSELFSVPLSAVRRALLARLTELHLDKLLDENFITHGNHAIYQITGLRLLSAAVSRDDAAEFCDKQLAKLVTAAFDENGVSTENSPSYHMYNLTLISKIQLSLFPTLQQKIRKTIAAAKVITPWLTDPTGAYYQIGDSEGKGPLLKPELLKGAAGNADYVLKDLASSGYQVVRDSALSKGFALVFHATNKTHIHAHADQLSFILYHNHNALLVDSGKYTYDYNKWRDYFISDNAHNTVGFVDKSFKPQEVEIGAAKLSAALVAEDTISFSGSLRKGDLTHSRQLELRRNILLVKDVIQNKSEQLLELRFHFAVGLEIVSEHDNSFLISKGGITLARLYFAEPIGATVVCGESKTAVQGWVSEIYHQKAAAPVVLLTYPADITEVITKIELL